MLTYWLKETAAPDGYNKLASDIKFSIDDEGNVKRDGQVVENNTIKVENKSGVELPPTGGIGTTIFYVVGAILVVAAAILLVTKKRTSAEG